MSTDLNMEYQEVKFGEIAKHISKRVEPSETTLEIYVGLEHLDPDSLKITRHGVPSDVAGQKLLVKKGQIIFGKRRAYQRKVAVADWDCICSAHAMVLEAIPGKILPEFLPFFMQSNQFMQKAVEISEGSLSPTIKWKTLEKQSFMIPKVEFTKALLQRYYKTIKLVDLYEKSISALEHAKNITSYNLMLLNNDFISLFIEKTPTLKKDWELKNLDFVLQEIQYGLSEEMAVEGSYPILRMSNLSEGKVVDNNLKYINLDDTDLERYRLNKGDILFNRTNSMDLVGKVSQFNLDGDYVFASYLLRLKVNSKIIPSYLNRYLNLPIIQYRLKAYATPSVNQANINPSSIRSFPIVLPTIEEQIKIDLILEKMDLTIDNMKKQLKILKKIIGQFGNIDN